MYQTPETCQIENLSDITKVATISAGNDTAVGSLIASAIDKVGREGLISLEEGKSTVNELEITEGMGFERGFISGYFVTNQERMEVILDNAFILLTDKKITLVKDEKGNATNFKLVVDLKLKFIENEENIEKIIELNENFTIKKNDNNYEQKDYERAIKNNMAQALVNKIIFHLSKY